MAPLRPELFLAVALSATTAVLAGVQATLDDETSLLQLGVRLPQASSKPMHTMRDDIPEAAFAWALFQEVPVGPPRPRTLLNDTALELPGDFFPDFVAKVPSLKPMLEAKAETGHLQTYQGPQTPNRTIAPSWVWTCFGDDFDINKHSTWLELYVTMPQLVPFIVPMDHPNRSDVSVIIAPGGGGTLLAWEAEGTDVAKWLNLLGISAFVLKYRVPAPVWNRNAAVMDAQRAVSLVKHMAPALGLNASRVGLFGASHGGWVATFTAFAAGRQYPRRDVVDDHSPRPDFLLLLYPELDTYAFAERAASSSPTGVHQGVSLTDLSDPMPIFVAIGQKDTCCSVESVYSFHTSLKQRGDPVVEINVYTDVGHGFTMCYRQEMGGWEAMQHEACVWMLRARHFIMWNVERKAPASIKFWYQRTVKFDSSLIATNSSGMRHQAAPEA